MTKNQPMEARAERIAIGLLDTTLRYIDGYITKQTWKTHTFSLWQLAKEYGVSDRVAVLLGLLREGENE